MNSILELKLCATLVFVTLVCSLACSNYFIPALARPKVPVGGPIVNDPNLKVDLVLSGLKAPTSMSFLGTEEILLLEKNSGMVRRAMNGTISKEPLIQVNVSKADERGLLGIALSSDKKRFFLYYTSPQIDTKSIANSVYRYDMIDGKLVNPKLILDLPGLPGPQHNGGKISIGVDSNLYIGIGDVGGSFVGSNGSETKAQNYVNGTQPDGRAGILITTQDGKPVGIGMGDSTPILNTYYAYGIKNIFGFDFDPVTGKMWDTENGPTFGDEINLIGPGFNSGWAKVQGIWYVQPGQGQESEPGKGDKAPENPQGLVNFGGKGVYSSPEFIWDHSVAPTALRFLNSDKLGVQYQNDMFVGDAKYGNIYHFKPDANRTGLSLDGPLADKVADNVEEMGNTIFGKGFGVITDLQVGPNGFLYVLSYDKVDGRIYKIVPSG